MGISGRLSGLMVAGEIDDLVEKTSAVVKE